MPTSACLPVRPQGALTHSGRQKSSQNITWWEQEQEGLGELLCSFKQSDIVWSHALLWGWHQAIPEESAPHDPKTCHQVLPPILEITLQKEIWRGYTARLYQYICSQNCNLFFFNLGFWVISSPFLTYRFLKIHPCFIWVLA